MIVSSFAFKFSTFPLPSFPNELSVLLKINNLFSSSVIWITVFSCVRSCPLQLFLWAQLLLFSLTLVLSFSSLLFWSHCQQHTHKKMYFNFIHLERNFLLVFSFQVPPYFFFIYARLLKSSYFCSSTLCLIVLLRDNLYIQPQWIWNL